jgi:hypothetical protein
MNTLSKYLKKKFLLALVLTHNHFVFVNATYYQIVNKITTEGGNNGAGIAYLFRVPHSLLFYTCWMLLDHYFSV